MSTLRFGSFLSRRMLALYQAAAAAVGKALSRPTELNSYTSYDSFLEDRDDISFVCSLPYVVFEQQGHVPAIPIVAPVLIGDRYAGRPVYFSDVVVRDDSPFQGFEDLRNRSWAYNEVLSQSGYGITRHHLVSLGETDGYFSEVVDAGSHGNSMRLVASGEVDGAAIDSQVLAVAQRDEGNLMRRLRVVDSLGPSTIQPVTVSKRVPADVRRQITEVLMNLHTDEEALSAMSGAFVKRFVAVGPESYDDVRAMVRESAAANFLDIR